MFGFTKEELASFYEQIVVNVASRLEIKNAIWKSRGELEIEINEKDEKVSVLLTKFFSAYQNWYSFSYDEDGNSKPTDGGEIEQHMALMNNRDKTRNNLLSALKSSDICLK